MLAPVSVLTFPLVAELPCPTDTAGGHAMAKRTGCVEALIIRV